MWRAQDVNQMFTEAVLSNDTETAKELLSTKKIDPNGKIYVEKSRQEMPRLDWLAQLQKTEFLELLLRHGAKPTNKQDRRGQTLLHFVASHGRADIVLLLVRYGADPTLADYGGNNVLHFAASFGDIESITFLLERGMNVNSSNKEGHTPLYNAVRSTKGKMDVVQLLVERGADPAVKDKQKITLLHAALYSGNEDEMLRYLLSLKKIDINAQDDSGRTPLHWAVRQKKAKLVKTLLEAGADRNIQDMEGKTPISYTQGTKACLCSDNMVAILKQTSALPEEESHDQKQPWEKCGIV